MRKRFVVGVTVLFVVIGLCWFRVWRNQQGGSRDEIKVVETPAALPHTNGLRITTLDQISSERLFEILAAPRPRFVPVVTNQYNGAPDVKSFIETMIVEQANRCNRIFRFATTNGQVRQLTLNDLRYSATTMTETFKFNFVTQPNYLFMVNFDHGNFEIFSDTRFDSDVFDRNVSKYEALRRATNYITKAQAVKLVEDALLKLGYSKAALKPFGEPYIRQLAFTHGGQQHVLPYYFIDYVDPTSDSEPKWRPLRAEVLGIEAGGRITRLSDTYWKTPPIPVPEGYTEKVEAYWRSVGKVPPRL